MAATLTLDTVDQSQVELIGNTSKRIVRSGIIEGVDATTDPEQLLHTAATLVAEQAPMGSTLSFAPYSPLTRIQVAGITPTGARVLLFYEPFNGINSVLTITTGSTLQSYQTNFHPGSKRPLMCGLDKAGVPSVPEDLLTVNLFKAVQQVSVFALRAGSLSATEAQTLSSNGVGYVNASSWMGRARGHWMCTQREVMSSRYAGYTTHRATAITNGPIESWKTGAVLFNTRTGKYVTYDGMQDDMQEDLNDTYDFNTSAGLGGVGNGLGYLVICPAPETDFPAIFGF